MTGKKNKDYVNKILRRDNYYGCATGTFAEHPEGPPKFTRCSYSDKHIEGGLEFKIFNNLITIIINICVTLPVHNQFNDNPHRLVKNREICEHVGAACKLSLLRAP